MLELIVILVIALIIFGPGKIPQIGGSIGTAIKELKKSISEQNGKAEDLSQTKQN
jgi:sec-independent protein translocase protein TatA